MPEGNQDNSISTIVHNKPESTAQHLKTVADKCIHQEITPAQAFKELAQRRKHHQQKDQQEIEQLETDLGINQPPQPEVTPTPAESLIVKDDYYREKEKDKFGDEGFIEVNQNRRLINDPLIYRFKEKVSSPLVISKLKKQGIENPKKFYKTLHEKGFDNNTLTSSETIKNCQGISLEEISTAIDRLNTLGINFHLADKNENLNEVLKSISAVKPENFDKFTSELNPYSFLDTRSIKVHTLFSHLASYELFKIPQKKGDSNPFLNVLLTDLKKGELNPEIKNRLDFVKEFFLLKDTTYDRLENYNIIITKSRTVCNSYNFLPGLFDLENKVNFALPRNIDDHIFNTDYKFLCQHLDRFDLDIYKIIDKLSKDQIDQLPNNENGLIDFLKDFSRTGTIDIKLVLKNKNEIKSSFKNEDEKLSFFSELITLNLKTEFSRNFRHVDLIIKGLINNKLINQDLLSDEKLAKLSKEDKSFWLLFRDFTKDTSTDIKDDKLIEISCFFTDLIKLKSDKPEEYKNFFDEDNNPTSLFLDTLLKNKTNIPDELITPDKLINLSNQDKTFWSAYIGINKYYSNDASKIDIFFADLIKLKSENNTEYSKFFDKDENDQYHLSNLFLESIVKNDISIPLNFISDHLIENSSNQDKTFWSVYKDIYKNGGHFDRNSLFFADLIKLKSENNNEYLKLFNEDENGQYHLSNLFLESIVKNKINIPNNLLTPDNFINFSDKDKAFWLLYKNIKDTNNSSYSVEANVFFADLIKLKSDKPEEYKNYFDVNSPTSLFFDTLLKENINITRELLSDEKIINFSNQDKVYWSTYRDIGKNSNNINTFFLENKSDFSKFLDKDNKFNSLFFESLITKDISITPDLLLDEKLVNFSSKDKKLWETIRDKNIISDKKICSDELVKKLINNKNVLIKDVSDSSFISGLFNQYSNKAEGMVNGYIDCISAGVISPSEKNLVSDFLKDFKIISPIIISEYKKAVVSNTRDILISHLKEMTQKMISSKSLDKSDIEKPYYIDLISNVYQNNSGTTYTTYESNNSCQDRSGDLSEFKIEDVYKIDLLSQGIIKVKENQTLDENIPLELQNPIMDVMKKLQSFDFDPEKCQQYLETKINEQLSKISNPEINLEKITSVEDRLFLLTTESIYGSSPIDKNIIKDLMITYQFTKYEDIRNFITGTTDRVNISSNKNYALLCELDTFYSDKIKDVNKEIIQSASKNQTIIDLIPKYFQQENKRQSEINTRSSIDKSRIDKLGLAPSFINQITRTLNQREEKKQYTPEEVIKLIYDYEEATQGLSLDFPSDNKNTAAFTGQLRAQREKTFNTARALGQPEFDPSNIHLGEINLQQLIDSQNKIKTGEYNQEQFISYTAQKFMDVFSDEVSKIRTELDKFISESGKNKELLNGYITKTKESANARMVGGVCVCGDNPDKNAEKNMWNMPEYLQFVFQDSDTLKCQGLVLMHHYIEKGKKVLAVSLNPSSTYLYSVDENALFKGILSQLETFASENNFDYITTSQNHAIRTNRTGGTFEKAIDDRVREVNEPFKFSELKTFSYKPEYQIQDMDVIWKSQTA